MKENKFCEVSLFAYVALLWYTICVLWFISQNANNLPADIHTLPTQLSKSSSANDPIRKMEKYIYIVMLEGLLSRYFGMIHTVCHILGC